MKIRLPADVIAMIQSLPREQRARLRALVKARWDAVGAARYELLAESLKVVRGNEPSSTSTYTPPPPYRAFRVIQGGRRDAVKLIK